MDNFKSLSRQMGLQDAPGQLERYPNEMEAFMRAVMTVNTRWTKTCYIWCHASLKADVLQKLENFPVNKKDG